ncbi:MAG TPA: hypothetical protein VIQ29_00395 [Ancylobacter sp.]
MTDKLDPAFEPNTPVTAPTEAPAAEPAEPVRRSPTEPARARSQIPEEPEAFRRWIEIEKLKVERKRLEYEGLRSVEARSETAHAIEPSPGLGYVSAGMLVLMVLLAAGMGYMAVQTSLLKNEVTQLRTGQAELASAIQTLGSSVKPTEDDRPTPSAWSPSLGMAQTGSAPPESAQPESPPAAAESAAPAATPAEQPAPAPAAPASAPAPEAEAPALMGTGYTVRIFAPTSGPNKKRLEGFTNLLKASGFNVDVSDASVVQSLNNSIAYHASEVGMANKVASLLQSKYPALDFELRASASIPEGAKRLFIMNLTEDAVN